MTTAMTNSPEHHRPVTQTGGLGTASVVLAALGFLPVPGLIASILGVAIGLYARMSADSSEADRRRAALGILLGLTSLALFFTFCIVYFAILGYPLPHIERYHPDR